MFLRLLLWLSIILYAIWSGDTALAQQGTVFDQRGGQPTAEDLRQIRTDILRNVRTMAGAEPVQPALEPIESDAERQERALRLLVDATVERQLSEIERTGGLRQGRRGLSLMNRESEVTYGEGQTPIECNPEVACFIVLDRSEQVEGSVLGRPKQWNYEEVHFGPPGNRVTALAISPKFWGVRTNLVVATDRRLYRFALSSSEDPKKASGRADLVYDEITVFSFPGEGGFEWIEVEGQEHFPNEPEASGSEMCAGSTDSSEVSEAKKKALGFPYEVKEPSRRGKRLGKDHIRIYSLAGETYIWMGSGLFERHGEWPGIRAFLGDEPIATNHEFETGEGGAGIWRLPMEPPTAVELYVGAGSDRKWWRAELR